MKPRARAVRNQIIKCL